MKRIIMKSFVYYSCVIGMLFFSACGFTGKEESISPIVDTDLPVEAELGKQVSFKIYHVLYNGCGSYSRHETAEDGKTITVTFYAEYPKGKICSDDEPTIETFFHFEPKEKGDYYFKFTNYDPGGYLLDTLSIK